MKYKVWVEIEELTDEGDHVDDIGPVCLPDCLGTFDTLKDAKVMVLDLLLEYNPEAIPTSDCRKESADDSETVA